MSKPTMNWLILRLQILPATKKKGHNPRPHYSSPFPRALQLRSSREYPKCKSKSWGTCRPPAGWGSSRRSGCRASQRYRWSSCIAMRLCRHRYRRGCRRGCRLDRPLQGQPCSRGCCFHRGCPRKMCRRGSRGRAASTRRPSRRLRWWPCLQHTGRWPACRSRGRPSARWENRRRRRQGWWELRRSTSFWLTGYGCPLWRGLRRVECSSN